MGMNDSTIEYIKNCKPALTAAAKQCQNISADETVESLREELSALKAELRDLVAVNYARPALALTA